MTFYSDPQSIIAKEDYKGYALTIMDVMAPPTCEDCGGFDCTVEEINIKPECPQCHRPLFNTTAYVVLIDDERQLGYHDTPGAALAAAKKRADELDQEAKVAAPLLTGKTDGKPAANADADAALKTTIARQGMMLGWGPMLAAIGGIAIAADDRPRPPGSRN